MAGNRYLSSKNELTDDRIQHQRENMIAGPQPYVDSDLSDLRCVAVSGLSVVWLWV